MTASSFANLICSIKEVFILHALVLVSGGLDSTTCLALAVNKHRADNVVALSISYGQRHARELDAANDVAHFYNVPLHTFDLADIFRLSNSTLLDSSKVPLDHASYAELLNQSPRIPTYVPFRNGLFLSVAAAFADSLFQDDVELFIGVHSDDAGNAYPDCSAPFIAAMSAAIRIATYEKIHIVAPFLCQTKADVVKAGLQLDAPYHLTWSCYERGDIPCGQCATCRDRATAFAKNGVKDPALDFLKREKFSSLL